VASVGAKFLPGEVVMGRLLTGTTDITTLDIYCTFFDFYALQWIVKGPLQPSACATLPCRA
jgi:hypothetical protein